MHGAASGIHPGRAEPRPVDLELPRGNRVTVADHPVSLLDELLPWDWRNCDGVLSQAA